MSFITEFENLTAAAISGFPAAAKEEHLQLEFKRINNANLNGSDDKKSLASAISGFANSSGGIVIWGIDARKNIHNVDCANEIFEISPLDIFLSRLNELSSQAASPPVDGIIHRRLETSPNRGFAATLIPESDAGPHMAKLGENRYYKRNGQQFLQLEHFDLEDMFGRRQKPKLDIYVINNRDLANGAIEVLDIMVKNTGKALARHLGVKINLEGATIVRCQNFEDASHLNEGRPVAFNENTSFVFHPTGVRYSLGKIWYQRNNQEMNIALTAHYYCEHVMPVQKVFEIEPAAPLANALFDPVPGNQQ